VSHFEKLKAEKWELDGKINALRAFIWDGNPVYDSLPQVDTALLTEQLHTMRQYAEILRQRLERPRGE
jgi:hypothetical protein